MACRWSGTSAGAIPETVPPGAGILVPPDDVAALAAALRAMICDPDRRETPCGGRAGRGGATAGLGGGGADIPARGDGGLMSFSAQWLAHARALRPGGAQPCRARRGRSRRLRDLLRFVSPISAAAPARPCARWRRCCRRARIGVCSTTTPGCWSAAARRRAGHLRGDDGPGRSRCRSRTGVRSRHRPRDHVGLARPRVGAMAGTAGCDARNQRASALCGAEL